MVEREYEYNDSNESDESNEYNDSSHSNLCFYHCFIAHTSSDRRFAVELYHILTNHGLKVFLDAISLNPGDFWDTKILNAQQKSLMTVILISSKTDSSYYQKEEIAEAIHLAKKLSRSIIPIYLEGENSNYQIPYGLRRIHGLYINNEIGLMDIAAKLVDIINKASIKKVKHCGAIDTGLVQKLETVLHEETSPEFKNLLSELEKARAYATENTVNACLIFFDIDGMTQINKKFGYVVGDLVIHTIEELFCKGISSSMSVFKIGSDEYVSFGLDCSLEQGMKLASDICSTISNYSWDTIAQDLRVTASFGVSSLIIEGQKIHPRTATIIRGETVSDWIIRGIFGSRNAKKEGGNRVLQGPLVLPANISRSLNIYIS